MVDTLGNVLRQLLDSIDVRFESFNTGLGKIENATADVAHRVTTGLHEVNTGLSNVEDATADVANRVKTGLDEVNETSATGLRRVSSGVAIVDVLKAMAEATETTVAIERSLSEVHDRKKQSTEAVELKRQEYDQHFALIVKGFDQHVREIGAHVYEIADAVLPVLDELRVNEADHSELSTMIEEAQNEVTEYRTTRLRSGKGADRPRKTDAEFNNSA